MFHLDKIPWDQQEFMRVVAHLLEVRPCASETVLEPLDGEAAAFLAAVNNAYRSDLRHFYSPQLRTLSNMCSAPLHYVKSFLYSLDCPKNSYIYDFYHHGATGRVAVRNRVSEGDLWQSLYNIDYMLSSFIALIETHCGSADERLRKLKVVYSTLHERFKNIFA